MIEYIITTQRVRVISGLFSKDVQEIELFRVKDTAARQAFFQRLFGLGTITVLSGGTKAIRASSLTASPAPSRCASACGRKSSPSRQRFGVREVNIM